MQRATGQACIVLTPALNHSTTATIVRVLGRGPVESSAVPLTDTAWKTVRRSRARRLAPIARSRFIWRGSPRAPPRVCPVSVGFIRIYLSSVLATTG